MKDNVDILKVQSVLLDMAVAIRDILEKYNIPYMIAYGTLLGAIRHEGFIPWDDDFDFYLFDDTYDLAIEYLRKELLDNYFVEDESVEPLYFHGWAHVKDLYSVTECKEFPQDSLYSHKGISVDLYRTKLMPLNELDYFLNNENRAYIDRRKNKKLITAQDYNSRMMKLNEDIRNEGKYNGINDLVYNLLPTNNCHYMHEENVFPLKKYNFNNEEFLGPNNADIILKDIYGDYLKLPPEEKRRGHYSSVMFL